MNSNAIVPTKIRDLTQNTIPLIEWEDALQTFLNTLGSPRTAKAYQRAVKEAMEALNIEYVADVTAPDLAQYRGGMVARMDVDSPDRLSPATVSLKLAGLRQFSGDRHHPTEYGRHSVRAQEPQGDCGEALPGAQ